MAIRENFQYLQNILSIPKQEPQPLVLNEYYQKSQLGERDLLEKQGIKIGQDFAVQNVYLNNKEQFIHSYRSLQDNQNKQKILLLHGYGMNGLAYLKIMKELTSKYEVHCIDLPGMGLSSRDKSFENSRGEEETIQYFVDAIEGYRRASGLDRFTIVGHSFGGFMAANYAMQYPQNLDNLVLLSTLGGTYKSQNEIDQELEERLNSRSFFSRNLYKWIISQFKKGTTISDIYQKKWYFPSKFLLNKYLSSTLNLNQSEYNSYSQYFFNSLSLPGSSDKAIFSILHPCSVFAKSPLEKTLPKKLDPKVPVHFVFGDKDWMDPYGAYRLFRQQSNNKLNIKFTILPQTPHQMTVRNPEMVTNYLLNSI